MRWIILACGVVLFSTAGFYGKIREATIAFSIGLISGFFLDWLGIKKFRFWTYPRQKFLTIDYFILALPDWGVISQMINLIWDWLKDPWLSFVVVAIVIFITHDLPNLKTKSWNYFAPKWLVVSGWMVYILITRIFFLACFTIV